MVAQEGGLTSLPSFTTSSWLLGLLVLVLGLLPLSSLAKVGSSSRKAWMTPAAQQCWTAACKGRVGGWPRVGRRALAGSARSSSLHSSGSAAGPCLSSRCSGGRHSQYF